jgi:lysozyme
VIDAALPIALALMRRFEGFYSKPYMCPAGVPTIGYGSTYYQDGTRVTLTDPAISRNRAEALLLATVQAVYLPAVLKLCPGLDHPDRLAALIDFTYNLGGSALKGSTLRKRVNAGDWDAVPGELRKWDKAGGRVLRGLTIRREAEAQLI